MNVITEKYCRMESKMASILFRLHASFIKLTVYVFNKLLEKYVSTSASCVRVSLSESVTPVWGVS